VRSVPRDIVAEGLGGGRAHVGDARGLRADRWHSEDPMHTRHARIYVHTVRTKGRMHALMFIPCDSIEVLFVELYRIASQ
jgi:hypothetical protein